MSAIVEKLSDAVNDVAATLGNTSISDKPATTDKSAQNDAVLASAAEGRRLYIGNLAYATTEGELQAFFKGYLMYVLPACSVLLPSCVVGATR
jgi:RNA recognition motif-containing protein